MIMISCRNSGGHDQRGNIFRRDGIQTTEKKGIPAYRYPFSILTRIIKPVAYFFSGAGAGAAGFLSSALGASFFAAFLGSAFFLSAFFLSAFLRVLLGLGLLLGCLSLVVGLLLGSRSRLLSAASLPELPGRSTDPSSPPRKSLQTGLREPSSFVVTSLSFVLKQTLYKDRARSLIIHICNNIK